MEKVHRKRRNAKGATSEELLKFDKKELVERIHQLEAHTFQLKNIIQKKQPDGSSSSITVEKKRPFDFSKCHVRRILLRILYFGWDYQGLAVQEDSTETVEHHLFNALIKTCLIESREVSGYHRCGRTDKGVSAFGQVISITVRSKFHPDEQQDPANVDQEIAYCKLLNRLLPEGIRAVAWMAIPKEKPEYSARFDCKQRLYKYYFPRGGLDIGNMRAACRHLAGSHDFRNLCKMDVGNGVTEFVRRIHEAEIKRVDAEDSPTSMYYLEISGNAFLWHQIRCIFGVLLLVGQGLETPGVVRQLLDVEANPRKPQYSMALDVPLNLYHCTYELEQEGRWVCEGDEMRLLIAQLQGYWTMHSVKSTMIKDCLQSLETEFKSVIQSETIENQDGGDEQSRTDGFADDGSERDGVMAHADCLLQGVKSKIYKPLLERNKCSSLEERIDYYRKRRRNE